MVRSVLREANASAGQSSSRPPAYFSGRRPKPTMPVPHIFGAAPDAFRIIAATSLQSLRRAASGMASRNLATLAFVSLVFGSLAMADSFENGWRFVGGPVAPWYVTGACSGIESPLP